MKTSLDIVIVNWNLKDDTLECIRSLLAAGATLDRIILIDNGSQDDSVEAFHRAYGHQINLITNTHNLGYIQACNQGILRAIECGADWILILNNDTIVAEDFFTQIGKALETQSNYGILSPAILYFDQPERIWNLGDHRIAGTLLTRSPYRDKKYAQVLPEILPVDFVSGCAMLVKRRVFEEIGLLDATLVMYGEEVDFCWRAHLAGYHMACITQARVWHKVSLSAQRAKTQTRYLRIRNQIRFYKKYASTIQKPILLFFTTVRASTLAIHDIIRHEPALIQPLFKGWRDGWFGV